jgi:thymidylate kinase
MTANKFMIEGLDRLGKDTLISGIQHKLGYHQVLHFSKPQVLECYHPKDENDPTVDRRESLRRYQEASFRNMFAIFRDAKYSHLIANRAHLGECVYAPLYRGYSGDYVFDMERAFMSDVRDTRLVLLIEDFEIAEHFIDDGDSFDVSKRRLEQEYFLMAYNKSCITDKRIVCVTDPGTGGFKRPDWILSEVLE